MKQYLGDGVYADVERGMLKLTAEDGIRATNTIYLEPEVCYALTQYMRHSIVMSIEDDTAKVETR